MFANRNQTVVRRITRSALRSDKRRNFFMIAAIALTVFMIASVFSVAISYYDTMMKAHEFTGQLNQALDGVGYGADTTVSPALYIGSGLFVAFFMLVGFLLIYNVMYVSVARDVRFYGLLKTIGTTPKQLRRIVNGQALAMYLIGFPIGLGLAAVTSFLVVPLLVTYRAFETEFLEISFSPLIYAGGAMFALVTTCLGSSIVARKASKLSPVEATRYAGEQYVRLKPHSPAHWKPSRMAWRNLFRERKRSLIVLLSLFLGITVFTGPTAFLYSLDVDANIDYRYDHDITIAMTKTGDNELGLIGMDRRFIEEIANIPGVNEVREETQGIAMMELPPELVENGRYFGSLQIIGIDMAYMEQKNEKSKSPIDMEAFKRGEIALVDENRSAYSMGKVLYEYFPIGKELYIEIGLESRIPVHTKIAGYTDLENMTGYGVSFGGDLRLIMSNAFLESISAKAGVTVLGINAEKGMEESVNATISSKIRGRNMAMASSFEFRRDVEGGRQAGFVLVSIISGIMGLIGMFNFINLMAVGLLNRKSEFAALESVGMSKKQMRRMLRWEGAIYWMITLGASVTAGTGFAYGLFWLFHKADPIFLPRFRYPVLPVAVVFSLTILICTITPEIYYRSISKNTLVERLREVE